MKKNIWILVIGIPIVLVLILLLMIDRKSISSEKSKKNFEYYKTKISMIVKENNYEMTEKNHIKEEQSAFKRLVITIDVDQTIEIWLSNPATQNRRSREKVNFIYTKNNNTKDFNLEFFIKIVNEISGRKITKEYVFEFLSDSEEQRSPKRYGIDKSKEKKVFKYEFLNWWENWSIGYSLYENEKEELTFWGHTNRGKKK